MVQRVAPGSLFQFVLGIMSVWSFCAGSPLVHMGFLRVFRFESLGKIPCVPSRLYSHLTPTFPGIGFGP